MADELRRRAEERLRALEAREPRRAEEDPRRLVHELEVHQIELEIQNEELRATRQQIEEGLQRYTELFDFAPIGYFVLGAGGSIRELNLAGARLLGAERQRLVGQRLALFVSEKGRAELARFLEKVLSRGAKGEGGASCELALAAKGAGARKVRLTAVALDGEVPSALVAAEDVTARRQAEQALRDEGHRKDEFLAVLSHELRNPLAPIRTSLYVLAKAGVSGEQAQRAYAVIERQVTHLTRIIDDLLDVSRIARGKMQVRRERLELGELVRQAMDDHRRGFESRGVALAAHFGSELFWVDGDPTRLVQVVGNLLGNAMKFTPAGGKVEVFLERKGQQVELSVRDTGLGIAPEVRQTVFEPFIQAPQALDRARGGLGLGLAMVKGLVELHGGTVDVESGGPGKGTEIRVRLPLHSGPVRDAAPAAPHDRTHHHLLVIEDNVDAADSLRDLLQLAGHSVEIAHDGPSGLALAREHRPEVVLCDIGLPGMDGYDVARAELGAGPVLRPPW